MHELIIYTYTYTVNYYIYVYVWRNMKKEILSREEFILETEISEENLRAWEQAKLLAPAGTTEDKQPFYAMEACERARQIKKLHAIGYDLAAIHKIIRKIGLPAGQAVAKKTNPSRFLTVGGLAERAGVSPRTIKHWEDKEIIDPDMRSEGGFRFYSEVFVYLCTLIKDLQLFGYTLEEIKFIADLFRDFLALEKNLTGFPATEAASKLDTMLHEIGVFLAKMKLFKEGIARWEALLKDKQKEINSLKKRNGKRPLPAVEVSHA